MKKFHILLFSACLLALSPAHAEQESPYKGGMNYTTINKGKAPAYKEDDPGQGQLKQSSRETAPLRATPEKEETEDTPASKVWKKYKALAAGDPENEVQDDSAVAEGNQDSALPADPAAQADAESQTQTVEPTGIAAIIKKYEQNKERQSQMQTIQIRQPTPPSKPAVETPAGADAEN